MNLAETLNQRKAKHGSFASNAEVAQLLKQTMNTRSSKFSAVESEALDMIVQKLARIATGDPHEADHWHDIAGYATLVVNDLGPQPAFATCPSPAAPYVDPFE